MLCAGCGKHKPRAEFEFDESKACLDCWSKYWAFRSTQSSSEMAATWEMPNIDRPFRTNYLRQWLNDRRRVRSEERRLAALGYDPMFVSGELADGLLNGTISVGHHSCTRCSTIFHKDDIGVRTGKRTSLCRICHLRQRREQLMRDRLRNQAQREADRRTNAIYR